MDHDAFSVVVPAYNAAETLPLCLERLKAARPAPAEIIVYDDGSTDETGRVAEAAGATLICGGGIQGGPSVGRNRGAAAAQHDTVVFVDADVAVEADALGHLVAAVRNETDVAAAFGTYGERASVRNLAGRYANLRHYHTHVIADEEAETFWTGLGAVDRETFLSHGGFDESWRWLEDVEFGLRLRETGNRIRIVPAARGDHLKDWTLTQLWRTDVVGRALPWSRLIVSGRMGDTLNGDSSEKVKSLLAHGILASAVTALFLPLMLLLGAALAVAYLFMNRRFLTVLRTDSKRLVLAGAGLHWLYHLYASTAFGLILARAGFETRMGRRIARPASATS